MWFFDWFCSKKEDSYQEEEIVVVDDFSNFSSIAKYIYEQAGITDLQKRPLASSKLKNYAKTHDIHTTTKFLEEIKSNQTCFQDVMDIVTVNETFFFRELNELNWLVKYIKNSSHKVNIASLPSSTGEEIYSILILMKENNIPLDKVELIGFDINSQAIQSAKKAIYDNHSIHKMSAEIIARYFTKIEDEKYTIIDELKLKPTFTQENIFNLTTQKDKYDVLISRNMFIYFDEKRCKQATNIIINLLKPNGIFIKGHADQISTDNSLIKISYGIYKN